MQETRLQRLDVPLKYPQATYFTLAPRPQSVPRNADIILNPSQYEWPVEGLIMVTCSPPEGKKICIQKSGALVDEAINGQLVAVKANVKEMDTILSFEGCRAGSCTWGFHFSIGA